jgi:hypothetical protein
MCKRVSRRRNCTGAEYAEQIIAEMLRVVFKLQNVPRAPGDVGRLAGFTEIVNETENNVYIKPNGTTSPWTGPMYLFLFFFFLFFFSEFYLYYHELASLII